MFEPNERQQEILKSMNGDAQYQIIDRSPKPGWEHKAEFLAQLNSDVDELLVVGLVKVMPLFPPPPNPEEFRIIGLTPLGKGMFTEDRVQAN